MAVVDVGDDDDDDDDDDGEIDVVPDVEGPVVDDSWKKSRFNPTPVIKILE